MAKDPASYVEMPYHYTVHQEVNADGPYWAARVAEVAGVSGSGNNAAEAIDSVKTSLSIWIEDALEAGLPIPEPMSDHEFSGQFRLRTPRTLHRSLVRRAEREGVSLNSWCAQVLAQHGT